MPTQWLGLVVILGIASNPARAETKPHPVFGLDKVWSIHLTIEAKDWERMHPSTNAMPFGPGRFGRPPQPQKDREASDDRKPHGLFGLDFEYVKGRLQIDDQIFNDVAIRFKGSGTYISSQGQLKRPFKIDLNRHVEEQHFYGLKKLTLNNNAMETTGVREVLAYQVFRELGVPAPRTAYAAVTLTIPGKLQREFLGLYVLAESVDKTFLKERFGSAKGLLLKPDRVGALDYLGENWEPYEKSYQPKTEATENAKRRLIDFTKLVQRADERTFRRQIESFLDVDAFLRFLAANVALSNMDSFIGMSRNYYLYLHPKTDRFVFIPWDVDLAFGMFLVVGSADQLMDLSIRQPYPNRNRLIERLLADEKVFKIYQGYLEQAITQAMPLERINKDYARVTAVTRPILAKERKAKQARRESTGPALGGMFAQAPEVPTFVSKRIESIQAQLKGERKGTIPRMGFGPPPGGGGGFGPPPGGFGPGLFLAKPLLNALDVDKDGKLARKELTTAAQKWFVSLTTEEKKELDEKALVEALDQIMPGPRFLGQRPPGGFPTLGEQLAKVIVEKAGKSGKVSQERFLEELEKLFDAADRSKTGEIDETILTDQINKLFPAPRFPPRGGPPRPGKP